MPKEEIIKFTEWIAERYNFIGGDTCQWIAKQFNPKDTKHYQSTEELLNYWSKYIKQL